MVVNWWQGNGGGHGRMVKVEKNCEVVGVNLR